MESMAIVVQDKNSKVLTCVVQWDETVAVGGRCPIPGLLAHRRCVTTTVDAVDCVLRPENAAVLTEEPAINVLTQQPSLRQTDNHKHEYFLVDVGNQMANVNKSV
uniref:Uncharacterized protein n=1 Tax=Arion vulgaris TaxID=1028688 RepID=A0A0B7B0U8_9EUPU